MSKDTPPRNLRQFLTQPRKPKIQLKKVLNLEIITTNMQYLMFIT